MITPARANRELQPYNLRLIRTANGYFDFHATQGAPEETHVPSEALDKTPDGMVDVTVDQLLEMVRAVQPVTYTAEQLQQACCAVENFKSAEASFERAKSGYIVGRRAERVLAAWDELQQLQDSLDVRLLGSIVPTSVRAARTLVKS